MRIAVPAARLKEIWDYLLTEIEKAGSIGKLLKDTSGVVNTNLDALITSRAVLVDYLPRIADRRETDTPYASDAAWTTKHTMTFNVKLKNLIDGVRVSVSYPTPIAHHKVNGNAGTAYWRYLIKKNGVIQVTSPGVSKPCGTYDACQETQPAAGETDDNDISFEGDDEFTITVEFQSYITQPAVGETRFLQPLVAAISVIP